MTPLQGVIFIFSTSGRLSLVQRKSPKIFISKLMDSKTLEANEQEKLVYLQGTYEQIKARLNNRTGHFMSAGMLDSQFQTLEEPQNALTVDISNTPEDIIAIICKGLGI